ncbi:hypothetical protein GGR52DRAFT_591381 [Hypoxylon sp. FL1284]|nr:hypothetical protein GGR52DRAFT_591381 [Hypoxylon sp. FL1284]
MPVALMANGSHEKSMWSIAKKNQSTTRPVKAPPKGAARVVRKFKELARRELWAKNDPNHRVDWKDDRVWDKITNEGRYHAADELMVSCGTVTVDGADSAQPKVMAVYNKNIGIYQLPKGRKNFGEGFLEAALRETAEETGVAVMPLRLRFGSRSTPPKLVQTKDGPREDKYGIEDALSGITEGLSNESIGASECKLFKPRHDMSWIITPASSPSRGDYGNPDPATNAWRHIYWYAARPAGDTTRDESRMTEEEDRKKFTTFWFSEAEAMSLLKLEDEKFMIQVTFAYLRNMSATDWASNRNRDKSEGI